MAYASTGGFAAPLGLWSGVVPTIVGSVVARTVLMVTTLTSAIAPVLAERSRGRRRPVVGPFAEVNRLAEEWPDPRQATSAAFVPSLRGSVDIPSATFLKAHVQAHQRLRARGVHLVT